MVTTLPLLRVMVNVAWAVAVADPRRAEQIARDIGGGFGTTEALAEIAKVIAVTDPCRAEHIASSIDDSYEKAQALADIARVVGATDRNRAAALACQADRAAADIDNEDRKVRVLGSRAAMPAGASPGRHGRKRRRVARADLVPGRAGHRSPDPASHRPGSVRAAEVPGRLHHPVAATHKPPAEVSAEETDLAGRLIRSLSTTRGMSGIAGGRGVAARQPPGGSRSRRSRRFLGICPFSPRA